MPKNKRLAQSLTLPCGVKLPNRIAKSAMSENMAGKNHWPDKRLIRLYKTWAHGGVGLCISGNVSLDKNHLNEAHNVVIEEENFNLEVLKKWNEAKKNTKMKFWLQLNHPGKQIPKFLCKEPVAPSAIALKAPLDKIFAAPRELNINEIEDIINRFAFAAKAAKQAGFDGVQIHGAHGYLVSQFLSPLHNQRKDNWGGSLKKRMNFVIEVYKAMRKAVGKKFPIGIKLNSADFQRGGFSHKDSIAVAKKLSELGIDLIEISGGSYESPVMVSQKESTKKREAYFLEYAKDIKKAINCPLMVTGGFRTAKFMEAALVSDQLDLIGLARPLALNPNFPKEILSKKNAESLVKPISSGFQFLDKLIPLEIVWYTNQLHRMGKNLKPNPNASTYWTIAKTLAEFG